MPKPNRRTFTQTASVLALSASSYGRVLGANDRIRMGFIGVGNRGDQLLDAFLPHKDCEPVAFCDVYEPYLPAAQKKAGGSGQVFSDHRKLLSDKSIDAVAIATPDHWHAIQFIDACKAGKDVYVEKPLSLCIAEGRRMCQVAADTQRVTQVGLHRRSSDIVREAVELIHAGAIGKIAAVKSYHYRNETPMGIGNPADGDPPAGLDWDRWLGPAPKSAFNRNKCLYKFRWFYSYSGGQLTNFGTHYLDIIQWALKQDAPRAVACLGGKYVVEDNRDIPDTMEAIWEYDNTLVTFSQFNGNASPGNPRGWNMEFRGSLGTMLISDGNQGYEIIPESIRTEELPALSPLHRAENSRQGRATKIARKPEAKKAGSGNSSDTQNHARNFLDCVKSRGRTNCPVDVGHRSTTTTLLAKLAYVRKKYLLWDAAAERVTNDAEANTLLAYEYRKPWTLG